MTRRLVRSVTNPAHFFPRTDGDGIGGVATDEGGVANGIGSLYASSVVSLAESRLAALDHCDRHVVNTLFADKLYYANKVGVWVHAMLCACVFFYVERSPEALSDVNHLAYSNLKLFYFLTNDARISKSQIYYFYTNLV